jgi:hypothetical protein
MDFFLQSVYSSSYYTKVCRKLECHPVQYTIQWTSLKNYQKQYLANPFVRSEVFMDLLNKTKRTQYALLCFFRRHVFAKKRLQECCNKFDFSMTPISEIKPSLLLHTEYQGKKYAFVLTDLFNIVKQALTHNIEIHSAPTHPVNPYTRAPFRNETLYLFFLKVHESHFLMPVLFYEFVRAGFDLSLFLARNEGMLREYAIQSTVNNMAVIEMTAEIRTMLTEIRVFDIASGSYNTILPNVILLPITAIKEFKPWLQLYFVYLYSLSPSLREKSYKKLIKSMMLFTRENPDFGIIKRGVVRAEIQCPPKVNVPYP